MATQLRNMGISAVGDLPWGTHFCHFYEAKKDLLDTLVPYFKAGLEDNELCLWVIAEPLTEEEAWEALRQAVPDLDRYVSHKCLEVFSGLEWYLQAGEFDLNRVTGAWDQKLEQALARGYAGIRVSGDTMWLERKHWGDFCEYEKQLNDSITGRPMTVLCTYPLAVSGAAEILDVARVHQFALARRRGNWEVIETSENKQARDEIKRLNAELEQRVVERTEQLSAANGELRREIAEHRLAADALDKAQAELAHVTRVVTMGELVASIAHEVNQPLGAIVTNGQACLRLLSREPPSVDKSLEVIQRMIGDGMRASEVIKGIRALLKKTASDKSPLSINETIEEVVAMASSEAHRSNITLLTGLAVDLPPVLGDRVQLQQVILNLILNGRDAMSGAEGQPRELLISSFKTGPDEVLIAVRDSGAGIDPLNADLIFEPFFTTKAEGMGLGLSISRTIIEAHGGRLWATPNETRGATIQFTLPVAERAFHEEAKYSLER
jgi:C4-dicarboxylate-specific signal transduction histidine kinase